MVFNMRTLSLPSPRTKDLLVTHGCPLKTFSLHDLKSATDNFSSDNIVGEGGFGKVYRGQLADGSLVAIKRRREEHTQDGKPLLTKERKQREELQFQAEVEVGGSPASNHRNVLRLLGYCMTRKERILVYPFIVHRSLASRLWKRDPSESPLDWSTRKRIALGAAKGLAHLHCGPSFTVIHRDIKASNVLLDDQFEAVLCDFGLAKFVGRNGNDSNSSWVQRLVEEEHHDPEDPCKEEDDESDQENSRFTKSCWNFTRTTRLRAEDGEEARVNPKWSCLLFAKNEVVSESSGHTSKVAQATYHESSTHISTAVRGTVGYIDPYYYRTDHCSVKSDVYGYGVVLLELVTGQRAVDRNRTRNGIHLLDWVVGRILGEDNLDSVIDSDLRGDYIEEELKQLIQLARACTECDPENRPLMTEVIKVIESMGQSPRVDQFFEKESPTAIHPYAIQLPCAATTQLIHESPIQTQEQFEAQGTASDLGNCVRGEPSHEIEPARVQPESVPVHQVLEHRTNKNKRQDFQVNITSGDFSLSFKFSRLSVWCVILVLSLSMNLVSIWGWANHGIRF